MDKRTIKGLKKSIIHWHENAVGKTGSVYSEDCALCQMFGGECEGCPVADDTNQPGCLSTPWYEASAALDDKGKGSKAFMKAAEKEIMYLVSLLPPGESVEVDGWIYLVE